MIDLRHYLKTDHEKAVRYNDYFEYYTALACSELAKGDFENAEKHMRYATNFINDLKRLHDDKANLDEVSEMLNRAKLDLSDLGEMIRRNFF